mmetsp:Transcript_30226/g.93534  ORF Transcript_30226/g.93534 Transcript_30226/m.93534 type:complete len:85 (-) Transcript_30226:77-331(-)
MGSIRSGAAGVAWLPGGGGASGDVAEFVLLRDDCRGGASGLAAASNPPPDGGAACASGEVEELSWAPSAAFIQAAFCSLDMELI